VTTALPTIVADFGGGKNYSWVGRYVYATYDVVMRCYFPYSAYMLVCASLSPLYGKLSDILGGYPLSAMECCFGMNLWLNI
jgi:MFS family permease